MSLIPLPWRILILLAAAAALVAFGWVKGASHVQVAWDLENAQDAERVAKVGKRQAEATVQVVTQYVDRIRVVEKIGDTIIKEVPVYVTPDSDSRCTVPVGFVRVHDAAAANQLPGDPADTDAAPAGIALSTVSETVAENYKRCHLRGEQIVALQDLIKKWKQAADRGGE